MLSSELSTLDPGGYISNLRERNHRYGVEIDISTCELVNCDSNG